MNLKNKKIAGYAGAGIMIFSLGTAGGYLGTTLANQNNSTSSNNAQIIKTSATTTPTNDTTQIAKSAAPTVVAITTETVQRGSFMQSSVSSGAGSGVIITKDGYIITNNHVVSGASTIKVTLNDNTEYEAKLIGSDSSNDIAVIKIDAKDLTVAAVADSDKLNVGEDVIAIGNPLGTLGGTVTEGILSATSRTITIDNVEMNLLQTTAAVNPGNSGGGLFNSSGELIGIVNAKVSSSDVEGIGFAIPSNQAVEIAEQIIANGGFSTGNYTVGITMVEITTEAQLQQYNLEEAGIYVYSVVTNSDAEAAGIKSGDRLVSINGTKITDSNKAKSLIKDSKKGDEITFVIDRDGREITITIEV